MLPQLHERVSRLECSLEETRAEVNVLRENITELRRQLQVEREPAVPSPANTLTGGISRY